MTRTRTKLILGGAFFALLLLIAAWILSPALQALGYQTLAFTGTEPVQRWSAEKLMSLGRPGLPSISALIFEPRIDPGLRSQLVQTLPALDRQAAPRILEACAEREELQDDAFGALRELRQRAVPALSRLLEHQEPRVRTLALEILAIIELEEPHRLPPDLLATMIHRLAEVDLEDRRVYLAQSLSEHAEVPQVARRCLEDEDVRVRVAATLVLRELAEDAEDAAVSALVCQLENDAAEPRLWAAWALKAIGEAAYPAVPALIEALDDPLPVQRASAAEALAAIDPKNPLILAPLCRVLEDREASVRGAAVAALARSEQATPAAVSALIALLDAPEGQTRLDALEALGHTGRGAREAIPAVLAIKPLDEALMLQRLETLGAIGGACPEKVLPCLIKALSDPDPALRRSAARALASLGPKAAPAIPALLKILARREDPERMSAVQALGSIDASRPEVQGAFIKILKAAGEPFPTDAFHERLLHSLQQAGPAAAAEALPLLLAIAENSSGRVGARALYALRRIGLASPEGLRAMIEALEAQDEQQRVAAAWCLGRLGRRARSAAPQLERALSRGMRTGVYASRALKAVGASSPEAVALLIKALNANQEWMRKAACFSLRYLGPEAAPAVPSLLKLAQNDPSKAVREAALWALGSIGQRSPALTAAVLGLCRDREPMIRRTALAVLSRISAPDFPVREALREGLRDPHRSARCNAALGLGRLKLDDAETLSLLRRRWSEEEDELARLYIGSALIKLEQGSPEIRRALKDGVDADEPKARVFAARLLGELYPDEPATAEALFRLLGDEDPSVRAKAGHTLCRIIENARSTALRQRP